MDKSTRQRVEEKVNAIVDREGPGGAAQIEFEQLASRYYDQPEAAVWQDFLASLETDEAADSPDTGPAGP